VNIVTKFINDDMVEFSSVIGYGIARWNGKLPGIDQKYYVEIDISDKFEWGENIFPVEEMSSAIKMHGSMLVFVAKVISCESDGTLTVLIDNGVVLIEAPFPSKRNMSHVVFYTSNTNVVLYPVDF
jgi:hypothetical protein